MQLNTVYNQASTSEAVLAKGGAEAVAKAEDVTVDFAIEIHKQAPRLSQRIEKYPFD